MTTLNPFCPLLSKVGYFRMPPDDCSTGPGDGGRSGWISNSIQTWDPFTSSYPRLRKFPAWEVSTGEGGVAPASLPLLKDVGQHAPCWSGRKSSVRAVRSAIRIASDPGVQTTRLRSSRRVSQRIVCDSRVAKRRFRTWILKISDPLKPGEKMSLSFTNGLRFPKLLVQ